MFSLSLFSLSLSLLSYPERGFLQLRFVEVVFEGRSVGVHRSDRRGYCILGEGRRTLFCTVCGGESSLRGVLSYALACLHNLNMFLLFSIMFFASRLSRMLFVWILVVCGNRHACSLFCFDRLLIMIIYTVVFPDLYRVLYHDE